MTNLALVFLTGLTTGGISCLAVQGGLLASSVARQVEADVTEELVAASKVQDTQSSGSGTTKSASHSSKPVLTAEQLTLIANDPVLNGSAKAAQKMPAQEWSKIVTARRAKLGLPALEVPKAYSISTPSGVRKTSAEPILIFLIAKLFAYTVLGALLGALGSIIQLSPLMRAVLQIGIGIFMLGTALRMLNVHPFFRYFVLEPPRFITRSIRRIAKNRSNDVVTPAFLGALTVLIPCGVTQAMMVLAVGTGDPIMGAAILFAFTLGTSPLFFTLAYLATRLGDTLHGRFITVAALTVFVLGLLSIQGGWNLLGVPLAPGNTTEAINTPTSATPALTDAQGGAPENILTINALDTSYNPSVIRAKAGQPVKIHVVTNKTVGCTRGFVIPALNIQKILPETGITTIELPPQRAGTLRFSCSMGMYGGRIDFVN